jgi:hypothetical protein
MATCNDLMTGNPVWCLASDVVSSAAQLMKDQEIGVARPPVARGWYDRIGYGSG